MTNFLLQMFNLLKHRGFFDGLIIWQEYFSWLTLFPSIWKGKYSSRCAASSLVCPYFPSSRILSSSDLHPHFPGIFIPIWSPSFQQKQVVRASRVFSAGLDIFRKVFSFFPVNMMKKLSSISCSSNVILYPLWRWREVSYLRDAERKTADKRTAVCCCLTWALRTVWE